MEEVLTDLSGTMDGLTQSQKRDFYQCVEVRFHHLFQQVFCEVDAFKNYKSLVNYILYMFRCADKDSEICQTFTLLLENGKLTIRLAKYIACNPSREKRQFSLMGTMYMYEKITCNLKDGLLLKVLDHFNHFHATRDPKNIYRDHIEWDFVNQVFPPFFCCAAKAGYAVFYNY